MSTMTEAQLKRRAQEWRRSVEVETGRPYSMVAAMADMDAVAQAHSERVQGQGYCLGCLVCDGTHLDVAVAEARQLAQEAAEDAAYQPQPCAECGTPGGGDSTDGICYQCQCELHALGAFDMDGRGWR